MNSSINLNDLPLERWDDLELLPETYVTDKVLLRTGGYD